MEHHRPSLASMQPGVIELMLYSTWNYCGKKVVLKKCKFGNNPFISHATPIQDTIFTPSTTSQEDVVAVAVKHDQDDVSSYANINVFEVGEVVAFRGTDGLPFNLLRVTHNISLRSLVPGSRVRGDLLKLHEMMTTFAIP